MPAASFRKVNPLNRRVSSNLDAKLYATFVARAASAGMSDASYLRHLIEKDAGEVSPTKQLKRRTESRIARDNLAHEVNALGLQFKKVGTNINQLAKHANQGLVAVTREEAVYMMNQLQLAMSKALSVLERALA